MSSVSARDWAGDVGDAETVRAVFEDMPMMLLATTGPGHRIIAANAAYRAAAGGRPLVGRTIAEAFPEIGGQQINEMYDRVYRTGQPQVARAWHIQADVERNGTLSDVYFDFTVAARRSADGSVAGLMVMAIDTTQEVRARQRAETAERRYEHARHTMVTLQRELLPDGLPLLPRVRLAAAYLAAEQDTAAGGDWFDAVVLDGGRVALTVGDVVGHGVAASAAMGQMRAVAQDRLLDTGDIVAAMSALDRLASRLPGARSATVCMAVLDPADGSLTYCTAGHPSPMLINLDKSGQSGDTADGAGRRSVVGGGSGAGGVGGAGGEGGLSCRYLPATGAGPLGQGQAFPTATATLGENDLIVLISDGLIERPGRDHAGSLVEIAQVAADAAADRVLRGSGLTAAQRVCTQTLEMLVRASGHADDVTILAAQRVAPPAPLRLELRAEHGVIGATHRSLEKWLRTAGVADHDLSALRHAVGELVTNCVEHAYRDDDGPIHLDADLRDDGTVRIEVRDEGGWIERRPTTDRGAGGLGLVLAGQVVDDLHLRPSPQGTIAEIEHAVRTPPATPADLPTVPAPESDPSLLLVLEQPGGRIRVDGPVTADTAGQLARDLRRFTVHGTRSLTVDLTGVTLLSSAGVAVLQEARRLAQVHCSDLIVKAEPGSPAHHVLALTDPGSATGVT